MFKRVIRLLFLFAALIICVSGCGKTGDSYENNETELLAQCYMDIIKNNYDETGKYMSYTAVISCYQL